MNGRNDRTDQDRLAEVTREVREGRYRIDSLDVADAVLRRWWLTDVVDEFGEAQSKDGSETSSSSD